jgi:hypothetical protein
MNKFGPEIQETVAKNMPENLMGEVTIEKESVENVSMMKILSELVEGVVASFSNFAKSLYALFSGSTPEGKKENSSTTSSLSLGQATYVALFSVVSFYGLSWLVARNSFFASQVQTSIEVNSSKLLK